MLFLVIYIFGIFIYDFVDTKKYIVRNDENGKNYIVETHGKNHYHGDYYLGPAPQRPRRRIGYLGEKKRHHQDRGRKRLLLLFFKNNFQIMRVSD